MTPIGHQCVFGRVGGRQWAIMFLGHVKIDRQPFVQHQTIIFDRWDVTMFAAFALR